MFPLVNRDVKNVEELIPLLLLIIPVTFKVENSLLYKNYLMFFVFFFRFFQPLSAAWDPNETVPEGVTEDLPLIKMQNGK